MIQKIKNSLKKRKVKVFLVFFLFSTLAWFISKLSEPYTSSTTLILNYENSNDNLLLVNSSQDKIDIKLEAVGFQFLRFNFSKEAVTIDLSEVSKNGRQYVLPHEKLKSLIDKELPNSLQLIDIARDSLFFDFQEVVSKEIPVKPQLNLSFAQNYLLDGKLKITPETVLIRGPKNEVDTISSVKSAKINLTDLTADFSREASLKFSDELQHTSISAKSVSVEGKVSRFSEKMISVSIKVLNAPSGTSIKTFPSEVSVLCKGTLTSLKNLKESDFVVIVDFEKLKKKRSKKLALDILRRPKSLSDVILQKTEVEYILKRE